MDINIKRALNIYGNGICKEFSNIIFDKFNEAVHKELTIISNEIISYHLNFQNYKSMIGVCDKKIIWD